MELCEDAELGLKIAKRIIANEAEQQELKRRLEGLELERHQPFQELDTLHREKKVKKGHQTPAHDTITSGKGRRWAPGALEGAIEQLLQKHPDGLTISAIKKHLRVHYRTCAPMIRNLAKRGALRSVTVTIPSNSLHAREQFPGYALPLKTVKEAA